MAKIVRRVFVSLAAIALCIALIVAGSYALYTDGVTIRNHLVAGSMQITLVRTNLISTQLDGNGYLATTESNPDDDEKLYVDFSDETEENVFGLNGSKIVPCSSYTAEMLLKNDSDVAFSYWVEIVLESKYKDTALAKQLKITVDVEDDEQDAVSKTLNEGASIGSESAPVGCVTIGKSQAFSITVTFEDLTSNNAAQSQEVQFDLIVHATQVTEEA